MMHIYFISIKIAMFVFPFIAIIATGGLLYFLNKKQQKFSLWQSIFFYSFIFYCICMFCLVIFPLPNIEDVAQSKAPWMQLKLFGFVDDFMRETIMNPENPSTLLTDLTKNVVIQPLFNIIMFMPFGFYYQHFFKKSFGQTLMVAFLLSFLFEITQLSGLYGIYPRPYRLFDVDDLLLNTFGAAFGFMLTSIFFHIFANKKMTNKKVYMAKHKLPHM